MAAFVWILYDRVSGFQISFRILTICKPSSFWPFKNQTSTDFRSQLKSYSYLFIIRFFASKISKASKRTSGVASCRLIFRGRLNCRQFGIVCRHFFVFAFVVGRWRMRGVVFIARCRRGSVEKCGKWFLKFGEPVFNFKSCWSTLY